MFYPGGIIRVHNIIYDLTICIGTLLWKHKHLSYSNWEQKPLIIEMFDSDIKTFSLAFDILCSLKKKKKTYYCEQDL